MSDDFKKKLEAYEKGEITSDELEKFEKELEKLELYQSFLADEDKEKNDIGSSKKKQRAMIKRGKWKARIQTALFALAMVLLVTMVSSVLTAVYYSWGTPDRVDVYRSVIDYTLTITEPDGELGGTSTNAGPFFNLEAMRDVKKRVGHDTIKVGELEVNFLFSKMGFPMRENFNHDTYARPNFYFRSSQDPMMSDWKMLEKLPEGTVVSAYISLAELMDTEEVFDAVEGKDFDLTWLVVDTGLETDIDRYVEPIGFPSSPIWHEDDMILGSREVEKGILGSKIISETHSSPEYEVGDTNILHEQFLKTLYFLKAHEKKANRLVFDKLELEERIQFIEDQGIKHYGIVITGPTKEILKLEQASWAGTVEVDEVSFWNWN